MREITDEQAEHYVDIVDRMGTAVLLLQAARTYLTTFEDVDVQRLVESIDGFMPGAKVGP